MTSHPVQQPLACSVRLRAGCFCLCVGNFPSPRLTTAASCRTSLGSSLPTHNQSKHRYADFWAETTGERLSSSCVILSSQVLRYLDGPLWNPFSHSTPMACERTDVTTTMTAAALLSRTPFSTTRSFMAPSCPSCFHLALNPHLPRRRRRRGPRAFLALHPRRCPQPVGRDPVPLRHSLSAYPCTASCSPEARPWGR